MLQKLGMGMLPCLLILNRTAESCVGLVKCEPTRTDEPYYGVTP